MPRPILLLLLLLGIACDSPPASGQEEQDSTAVHARSATDIQMADSLAENLIARADSALQRIDPLSSREEQLLRRYVQDDHLAHARRLGIDPIRDRRAAGERLSRASEGSGVVQLRTNDLYIIDPRMGYAVPLVVPSAAHVVERIGRRFQQNLEASGLPPYRFILTNLLRTGVDQAHLRGVNTNAARGESAHEYGTTFDIYYGRFHYAAERDAIAESAARQLEGEDAHFRMRLRRAYRDFGRTHAEQLKAAFGRTLLQMQEEGVLLAMYERRQPVYHLTVAADVEAPPGGSSPGGSDEAAAMRRFYANAESQLSDVDDDIEDLEELAAEAAGASRQRLEQGLTQHKRMRDALWYELDRFEELTRGEFREARSSLRRSIAALEGEMERTRIESAERPQGVQHRLRTRLQNADRALSQLEAQVENAPRSTRTRYEGQISDLRTRHGELAGLLSGLEGASGAEFESVRSQAAAASPRLVTDLQVVVGEVNDAGE